MLSTKAAMRKPPKPGTVVDATPPPALTIPCRALGTVERWELLPHRREIATASRARETATLEHAL